MRRFLVILFLSLATPCLAQAPYPTKPIRLVVAFPPGGSTDLTARLVAGKMQEALGQPIVVDNRAGANGIVGTDAVAKAPADGYVLLLTDRGALGVNPSLYRKLPYDPLRDFDYVGIAALGLTVLAINATLPARTLKEFIDLAKSKPGAINYASFGVGSLAQLNMESFKQAMGIDLVHVPYKGAGPAVAALAAAEVGAAITGAPPIVPYVREGRVRALALVATQRWPGLPEVPTVVEAGIGADTIVASWFGFAAPAGTPRAVIARLSTEARHGVLEPGVSGKLSAVGLQPVGGTPQEMGDAVKEDVARFARLVKAVGIQPE